ncbi:MAG: response regulator [Leptolyngbyaceae cyanobacterium SM1_1_3]|nr:response regulator [Leptolyngbyaceae cyanobacterium SM1_1_3]
MQSVQVGVLLLNEAGQITFANPAAVNLLGLPNSYMGKLLSSQIQLVDRQGESVSLGQLPIQQTLATGQPTYDVVLGIKLATQALPRWLRFDVDLQSSSNSSSNRAIAPITQLICTCVELAPADQQGHSKLADGAMLAYMGHELRTPLNAILGFTQLMQRDPALAENHRELLNIIERSGEQLLSLISDLVELGKIQAGQINLNLAPLNLQSLLMGLEQMLCLKAEAQGLKLRFELAAGMPTYIEADEGKLRQSLLSLISSLIKLSQTEPVQINIQSVASDSLNAAVLRLQIQSTTANATQVRSQLSTATQPQNPDSWNLRFTISQKLIQMLGGALHLGAAGDLIAVCELPIVLLKANPLETKVQSQVKVIGLALNQPPTNLVADDDAVSRLLMVKLLKEAGFKVKQAVDGQQAVQLWQEYQPDLICMDMRMPKMDGYEATQQIRVQAPTLPILVLTANELTPDQVRAGQWHDLVPKPIRRDLLLDRLQQHLELEYRYEQPASAVEPSAMLLDLQIETLQQMPAVWLQDVYQAAAQGSDRLIYQMAQQLPAEKTALARALTALADEFQFDQILKCLQRAGLES